MVIQKEGNSERSFDLFSRLLKDRVIFITGEIEDQMASIIVAELLFLDSDDNKTPISMYINSPGGVVSAGLAIIDTMHLINADVHTYCVGICASMGAMIFSQGKKGNRYILEHAELMIHQPLGGARGQATDILIQAKSIAKTKKILTEMLSEASGQPFEKVADDCERDHYLDAEETVEYGLADSVIKNNKQII